MDTQYEQVWRVYQSLKEKLTDMLVQRDELLFWTSGEIETEYMEKIGILEYKAMEFRYQAQRLQKKLGLLARAVQDRATILLPTVEEALDRHMAPEAQKLLMRRQQVNRVLMRPPQDRPETAVLSQLLRIYREAVKRYHADLYPDQPQEDRALFINCVSAFRAMDADRMQQLYLVMLPITDRQEQDLGIAELRQEIARLRARWAAAAQEVRQIRSSFPMNQAGLLLSGERVLQRQAQLREEIDRWQAVYQEAEAGLTKLLEE